MYFKLSLLYFLILIACLAGSCTSDSPENEDVGKRAPMSFAVSDLSRATVTTSFDRFAVYGDMKLASDIPSTPVVLFNKTEVLYKTDSWSYEGTQYWVPKHEHSFVAVSPLSVLEAGNSPRYSNSQLTFTYAIPASADNKVSAHSDVTDIIAATHRRLYNEDDVNTTTTFKFMHLLSLINIAPAFDDNIMSQDDFIAINSLELTGFSAQATFNILPASRQTNSQTDDMVIDVTGHEGAGSLTIVFAEPKIIKNDRQNVSLFAANDAIIMLPQAFDADSGAAIRFSYTINNDPTIKYISLPLMNQKWESGKSYTYRFTIDRTGAHFQNATISEWDVLNTGNIDAH